MARTPKPESDPTRIGVERYLRFVAEGLLDDDRVELLDGVIVPMTPSSPSHAAVVHLAAAASYRSLQRLGSGASVRPAAYASEEIAVADLLPAASAS